MREEFDAYPDGDGVLAAEPDLESVAIKAFEVVLEERATQPRPALADILYVMYDVSKEGLYFLTRATVDWINKYVNYYWTKRS